MASGRIPTQVTWVHTLPTTHKISPVLLSSHRIGPHWSAGAGSRGFPSGEQMGNLIRCPLPSELGNQLKSLLVKVKVEREKFGLKLNIQKMKIMASSPITSWEIDGETVSHFIFLSSKITADDDCSHEIKRRLLLGRKVMTNLDSILKSRDITLPTKVRLVKAMVFPVVVYGCESWTVKKAER